MENDENKNLENENKNVNKSTSSFRDLTVGGMSDVISSEDKIIDVAVKDELEKSFIAYAMAVNVSRAIPDVRDGLKPVHRRILYTMADNGLFADKPYRKCAKTVGDVLGRFHPHGDSSVYDALVRLAQDFTINQPLIDGHGNFGSVDGDPPAAMRYTEARLSKVASEMLRDLDKETVDFYPNFDETENQPVVLPSRFPNILVNGSDGIAVGMATNIPPHNLSEACDAAIAVMDNPDIEIEDLMQIIPAPDFPTKGLILGRGGIKSAYKTGKGSFIIRSRCEIEEYNNGTRQRIVVTEIPYQVNKSKLIMQIADLVKDKRIEGISDIKEESDRSGMRIVIEVKRDHNAQVVLNQLYKHSQLQISYGVIMLALVKGQPKILNLKEVLTNYIDFQKEVIARRTKYDLDKNEQKAHILEGLVKAQANIDEVIKIIKESADKNVAITKLMANFDLTEKQTIAILEMRLQRLTGLEVEKLKAELDEVLNLIAELKSILASEEKVKDIIRGDLINIKTKYGEPRKSEISIDFGNIDDEDLIPREQVVISLTHEGYIKRMPIDEYKSQHRGGVGVIAHKTKEEDFVEQIFVSNTHDSLLCFSTAGRVYRIKGYEVPEALKQGKGRAIINLLQLDQGERITTIIPIKKDTTGNLIMATKKGLIKKTALSEFDNIRKFGKIAIKLTENDSLISVFVSSGKDDIIMASNEGKCIRFNEKDVRLMGRDTQGVKSINLADDDYVVDMSVVDPEKLMLTVSEFGFGKRTQADEYKTQSRNGKGTKAGIFNEQTGRLVNLKQVTDNDDIMIIADDGTIIRIKASEINVIGRNTKGVKIMKMKPNSKIVCVAVTPSDEEEQELIDNAPEDDSYIENAENLNSVEEFNNDNFEISSDELNNNENSDDEI